MAVKSGHSSELYMRRLYKECVECVKRLDQSTKDKKSLTPIFAADIIAVRKKLCDTCEKLLFHNPLEYGKKAEEIVWRKCFYEPIQHVRRNVADLNSKHRAWYSLLLSSASGYYVGLLIKIQQEYKINLNQAVNFTVSSLPWNESTKTSDKNIQDFVVTLAHRVLIYLGDLARYQQEFEKSIDTRTSQHYYHAALRLKPNHGQPHNQLGTLFAGSNHNLDAAFCYLRCVCSPEVFSGAEGNLLQLLEKNQKSYENCLSEIDNSLDGGKRKTWEIKYFLTSYLNLCKVLYQDSYEFNAGPQLQQICQQILQAFTNVMSNLYPENVVQGDGCSMESSLIVKLFVMLIMLIKKLQDKSSFKLSASISLLLSVYTQFLTHIIAVITGHVTIKIPTKDEKVSTATTNDNSQLNGIVDISKVLTVKCETKSTKVTNTAMSKKLNILRRRRRGSNDSEEEEKSGEDDNNIRQHSLADSDVEANDNNGCPSDSSDDSEDVVEIDDEEDEEEDNSMEESNKENNNDNGRVINNKEDDSLNGNSDVTVDTSLKFLEEPVKTDDDVTMSKECIEVNEFLSSRLSSQSSNQSLSTPTITMFESVKQESVDIRKLNLPETLQHLSTSGWLVIVKVMCDWLHCNSNLIVSIGGNSKDLWNRFAQLLNLLPRDDKLLDYVNTNDRLSKELYTSIYSPLTEWYQKYPLVEDVYLRGVLPLAQAHTTLDYAADYRYSLESEAVIRVCCLRSFGHYLLRLNTPGFQYDRLRYEFFGQLDGKTILEELDQDKRENVMRNMAKLRLKDEKEHIEKVAWIPVYLVVDTSALCDKLFVVKQLASLQKFVIVIPKNVVTELDRLKKDGHNAREAIRWLESQFQRGSKYVRSQKLEETAQITESIKSINREMVALVDCAAYLSRTVTSGASTVVCVLINDNQESIAFNSIKNVLTTANVADSKYSWTLSDSNSYRILVILENETAIG